MSTVTLIAESRAMLGKGASRRLRKLEDNVPGIVYGGSKAPVPLVFKQKEIRKALENESIYSSVFDVSINGKKEQVILKALQRHPYKPVIMHLDLQRVSAKSVLVKMVPLHFINEAISAGVKKGGSIQHAMTQLEVRCEARNLPEFIEVDMANVDMDQVVHLSDLKLPKGVELTVDASDHEHDTPVVSIHKPKAAPAEESEASEGESAAPEEGEQE